MTRARLGAIASLACACLGGPFVAEAQPAKMARIVVVGVAPANPALAESFKQGLGEAGYADGKNFVIDYRDAGGDPERLSSIAPDLVQPNVDLIHARGAGALTTAKEATERIPIVAVDLESDPVAKGFVRTLAPSGGNITGVFLDRPELSGHAGRILQGAKPGALPVERPTKFERVINRKTAKALGLTIPPSVLARAYQIVE